MPSWIASVKRDSSSVTFLTGCPFASWTCFDSTSARSEERQKIITVNDKEITDYIDKMCESRHYVKKKPVYIDFKNPKFNCNSYDFLINLDGNGNVGGCMRQIPPNSSFGNVFKEKDPFNSLRIKNLRKRHFPQIIYWD